MMYEFVKAFSTALAVMIAIPIQLLAYCVAIVDNVNAMLKAASKRERSYRNIVYYMRKH